MTELETWRREYVGKLAAPYGWWAITALAWLEPGDNLLGSEPEARAPLPARAPGRLANLHLDGEELTVTPLAPDVWHAGRHLSEPLTTSGDEVLFVGNAADAIRVNLIRRSGLFGARVYDPQASAARDPTSEVAWFPADSCGRVEAAFEPARDGETIAVVNVIGQVTQTPVAGRASFEHAGHRYTLLATAGGRPDRLFFNFKDATNQGISYGGGRFLNVDGPSPDGRIVLDFNYAHHPPCAHTPYATCPTPSPENCLPFGVLAGERYAGG